VSEDAGGPLTEFAALLRGAQDKDVARRFGVSLATVRRWRAGETYPHPSMLASAIRGLRALKGKVSDGE
jgi:hypothetical protein